MWSRNHHQARDQQAVDNTVLTSHQCRRITVSRSLNQSGLSHRKFSSEISRCFWDILLTIVSRLSCCYRTLSPLISLRLIIEFISYTADYLVFGRILGGIFIKSINLLLRYSTINLGQYQYRIFSIFIQKFFIKLYGIFL